MNKKSILIFFFLSVIGNFISVYSQCSHTGKKIFIESLSPGFSKYELKYDVNYYHINIETNNTDTYINAFTDIVFTTIEPIDTIVFELSDNLTIDSIFKNTLEQNNYLHSNNLIYIYPDHTIDNSIQVSLRIYYHGLGHSSGFFSGIANRTDFIYDQNVTYTLSEPFQASSWFPVKQDLNDKADSVRVYISVDENLMAGSNGVLEEIQSIGSGKVCYKWFSKYPIAYYLISYSVADYIDYSFNVKLPNSEDTLLVQNYIYNSPQILELEKENIDKTGPLLELFSDLFGTYPFVNEKYGHCMAPMGGGMEHQTMTTLQNFNFQLVAHELAHQWFGDYVTCSSWQDIWINEGFASYSEYLALEFLEDQQRAIQWMDAAHDIALNAPTGSIYLPLEEAENANRIFDYQLSYKKGASIINMLRYELNDDEMFFTILKTFLSIYKNSVASGQNFLEVLNENSGQDFSWFFDQWYYGEGYPIYQLSYRSIKDSLYIKSVQSGSGNIDFFKSHFDLKLFFENGTDTLIRFEQLEPISNYTLAINSDVISVQMDPFSRLLMKSFIFEYLPEYGIADIGPNPFSETLHFIFSNVNTEKELWIREIGGQVAYHKTILPTSSLEINLSFLKSGVYILTLEENSQQMIQKILKL